MPFGIKVEGLDKIEADLHKLQDGLTLPTLQHWASEIERKAKEVASNEETRESIHVEVSEPEPKTFEVKANANEEALPLIIEATENLLQLMPLTSQTVFESFLEELEKSLH